MRDNGDVLEKIARLRERLAAPGPTCNQDLSRKSVADRLARAKERLETRVFDASHLAVALLEPLESKSSHPPSEGADEASEFRALRERIEEFIEEFADWGEGKPSPSMSAPMDEAEAFEESSRVRKAYCLAEFTRDALRACEGSINRQLRIVPALHEIHDHLSRTRDVLVKRVVRQRGEQALLDSIRDVHLRAMDGSLPGRNELESLARGVLQTLQAEPTPLLSSSKLEAYDSSLVHHSLNTAKLVAFLTSRDAEWMPRREDLIIGALLQDAGMLGVPTEYLAHDGPLSEEGKRAMERHPLVASVLLERLASFPHDIAVAVSRHHERMDGMGYPQRLNADHLDPVARLYAVADAFAALREPRPHRPCLPQKQALTFLLEQVERGELDEFWSCGLLNLGLYPVGSTVELSTGETAEVVAAQEARSQPALAALPVVRMLTDPEGKAVYSDQLHNLAQYPHLRVVRTLS